MNRYFKEFFTIPQPLFWKPLHYRRESIQTICIFSEGDKIGDALFKIPLLKTLRKAFPEAKVTYLSLIHSAWHTILKVHTKDFIDEMYEDIDMDNLPSYGKFDLIIDLNHRAKITKQIQSIPHKFFVSNTYGGMFGSFVSLYPMKKVHRVARHMLLLRKVGVTYDEMIFDPTLPISREIEEEVLSAYNFQDSIALLPAAGDRRRCWSLENYKDLAIKLLEAHKKVIVIFGPQDRDMYEDFYATFGEKLIYPLQEHPAWMEDYHYTMAIAKNLKVSIGNDSGVTHLAVAGGGRLIAIYGRIPPQRAAVIGVQHQVVYRGKDIEKIKVDDILKKLGEMGI